MLRTPTTYLLPVTVISPAMCVEAMMISAPLNSLLYSPTAQLFTVWSMFDWVMFQVVCRFPLCQRRDNVIEFILLCCRFRYQRWKQ